MRQVDAVYLFGPFRYDSRTGQLFRERKLLALQARTIRILTLFLERPGEVIPKEELLDLVWPERVVEENTLTHHISNLRRVLGDDLKSYTYIVTIPGKGYLFNHPVTVVAPDDPALRLPSQMSTPGELELEVEEQGVPTVPQKEGGEASPPFLAKRMQKTSTKALIGLLLGGIGAASLLWWGWTTFRSLPTGPAQTETPLTWLPFVSFPEIERQPAFSPDGRQVVFSSSGDSTENVDLYLKEFPSGSLQRLTSDPRRDHSPVWSPDGRQIAFLRDPNTPSDQTSLMILSLDSQIEEEIGQLADAHDLDWSPDGRQFVISENRYEKRVCGLTLLTLSETQGRRESLVTTRLTETPDILGHHQPNFSPDGRWVAFIRSISNVNGDLYLLNLSNGQLTQLTDDKAEIFDLEWSLDGEGIFFVSNRSGQRQLWKIQADGRNLRQMEWLTEELQEFSISPTSRAIVMTQPYYDSTILLRPLERNGGAVPEEAQASFCEINSTREEHTARFSPDGQTLVYVSNQSGFMELWLAKTDCTEQRQLTRLRSPSLGSPRWSPDGSMIAFDHHEGINPQIFTVEVLTGIVKKRTADDSRNLTPSFTPSWSADGEWIYFTSRRAGVLQCWKVAVAGGPPVLVNSFGCFEPVESPNGESLYFTRTNQLWIRNLQTGGETPVPELRPYVVARHWQLTGEGLFFASAVEMSQATLFRLDLGTRKVQQVTFFEGPFFPGLPGIPRFSISPDEKWLASYRVLYQRGEILFSEKTPLSSMSEGEK